MTTITKERLIKIQQWRETYGAGHNVMLPADEAEELARIALASMEDVPVAMSDHRFRELVNTLRDIAIEYHGTQQLREHIARACRAAMPVSAPQQEHDHG